MEDPNYLTKPSAETSGGDRGADITQEPKTYTVEELCGIFPGRPGQSADLVEEIREAVEEGIMRRLNRGGLEE